MAAEKSSNELYADESKLIEDVKLEEKRAKMNPKHLEAFDAVEKGDLDKVKNFLSDGSIEPDICDENGMSLLLQASYRGHVDIVTYLLSNGADVNLTCHTNFYTPLMLAAVSGKLDTVKLLLEAGAKVSTVNSIDKTASDLAAFVGQPGISAYIRNYLSLDRLEPYYTRQGDNAPRISKLLAMFLHEIVMSINYSPVKIVITVRENKDLENIENLKKCKNVLEDLYRKSIRNKQDFDEVLALKLHYISGILQLCQDHLSKEKPDLGPLIKSLLKENDVGIKIGCDRIIRQILLKFPNTDLPLLQYLVKTLSPTKVGEEPTALSCIHSIFNGAKAMMDSDTWCMTCGDRDAELRCSACKQVRYCSQRCQKLHWFLHKKKCAKESK